MPSSIESLRERLASPRTGTRVAAMAEAIADGSVDAELALVDALSATEGRRKVELLAALGDLRRPGPADDELRSAAAAPGAGGAAKDLRAAAVVALAKRLGAAATPDIAAAVVHESPDTRHYGVKALAAFADARAWPAAVRWMRTGFEAPYAGSVLTYVARTVTAADEEQRMDIAAAIRRRWYGLPVETRSSLARAWPHIDPAGPADPGVPASAWTHPDAEEDQTLFTLPAFP